MSGIEWSAINSLVKKILLVDHALNLIDAAASHQKLRM
jgi:hypothetical protein